jgi:hypothetical protein
VPVIDRTNWNALVDDDGSNTVGTLWTKDKVKTVVLDPVDTAIIGKRELWIPAKDWFLDTNNPCAALATRSSGVFQDYQHLAYDGLSGELAHTTWTPPKSWNLGTITYNV